MLKKLVCAIKKSKQNKIPKFKKSRMGRSDYSLDLKNNSTSSLSNLHNVQKYFETNVNKIYLENQNANISLSSWIFAMHPKLADYYNIKYDKGHLSLFNSFLQKKGIKKIIYFKDGIFLYRFKVIMKNGEVKYLFTKDANNLLKKMPLFFLDLQDPKTRARLKELKIIN